MNNQQQPNDRTLSLERTFNAPLQLVWEAWTQSDHIAHWWGPKGMQTTVIEHDFRVGGQWKYSMQMPDGKEFISEGKYLEIEELKKIISTADFKPMTEGVEIQAFFEADGDQTKFTFNVVHTTAEYCQQQEQMGFYNGWGSVFDRLGEFLQRETV
ncbi:activator of HSP90 ATPase [marine bacterium AO1-C]|nr:activator of HSP90 ATPase [marine bacterium AO1-C]